jgi:hypothetical protein
VRWRSASSELAHTVAQEVVCVKDVYKVVLVR